VVEIQDDYFTDTAGYMASRKTLASWSALYKPNIKAAEYAFVALLFGGLRFGVRIT
jgi:hypothetical protein